MTSPASAGNRRALIILGVGLALAALIFVVPKLLGGGGKKTALPTDTTFPGARTTTTTTSATGGTAIETFEIFTTKNPFQPPGGIATGGTTTGGTTTGGTTTGGTTTGGTTTGGTTSGGTTTGGSSGSTATTTTLASGSSGAGSSAPARSQRVSLLDIFQQNGRVMANVRVDSTAYKVGAGDQFATRYKVVSLSETQKCGQFLFGDDSFRLCEGEEVIK